MRIRNCVALFLFCLAAFACSDSVTAPVTPEAAPAETQTAVMTVTRPTQFPSANLTRVYTGLSKIDSTAWELNLSSVADNDQSQSVVTDAGAKVPLALVSLSAPSIVSDGIYAPVYEYITDWSPIDAGKHKGVKVDSVSSVFLLIFEYPRTNSNVPFVQAKTYQTVLTYNTYVNVRKQFSADKNVYRNVVARRVYSVSCVGNDELTFASPAQGLGGVIQNTKNENGTSNGARLDKVDDVVVKCSMYKNYSAARLANPGADVLR